MVRPVADHDAALGKRSGPPGRRLGSARGRTVSEQAEVLGRLAAWADGGIGVALAAVMDTWGSAPRRPGSLLAVNARSEFAGSVSGGCVEAAVIEA